MNIEFSILSDIADAVQGRVTATYSGRGMYGKRCIGITIDESDTLALGGAIASLVDDEGLRSAMLDGWRSDSMGRGQIIYWPAIQCDDADDEDEGEYE